MVMLFNEAKRATVAIVPKISGFLSLCGSSWIIVEVLTAKGKRKTVYNRLLLSMSIFDAAVSITYIASTWPIPRFSPTVVGAFGTVGTCTAQGFFNQLGIVSPIYNVCLGVYYVLVLKYGITEVSLRTYVEPVMHISAVGFGLGTAIAAIPLTLFNNADLWCWIAPLPFDCDETYEGGIETPCVRGDNAFIYRWAFFYAPLWLCMLFVLATNARVFLAVRKGEKDAIKKQEAHDKMHGRDRARDLLVGNPMGSRKNQTSVRLHNPRHRRATSILHKLRRPSMFSLDGFSSGGGSTDESTHRKTFRVAIPENWIEKVKNHGLFGNQNDDESLHATKSKDKHENSIKTEDIKHVMEVVEDFPSAAKQYTAAYQFASKIIVAQCLAYTVAFFLAWTASSVNRVVQHNTGTNYFGLLLLQGLFEPLQGLFNVLVYRFGYFLRLRAAEQHLSRWEVFKLTWTWSFVGTHRDSFERKSMASNGIEVSRRARSSMTPSARASVQSRITKGSSAKESYMSSSRGSAIEGSGLKVNVCHDDAYATAQDHVHSLMGQLMFDYTENPSLINQKMVVIQTDFPQFVMDDFDYSQQQESPTPASFPVPLTPTEEHPVVASMADFPAMMPMTDDSNGEEGDGSQEGDEIEAFHQLPMQIPSDRSSTLISVNSSQVTSDPLEQS